MGKVYLGDEVKDSISGFKGIATGRAEYLTGCVQVLVAAKNQKVGEKPTEYWLDEQRLVVTSAGAYGLPEEEIRRSFPAGRQPEWSSSGWGGPASYWEPTSTL